MDVNGDGLPDHVARDQNGAFQVKINHGDHWGEEQAWTDPDWPGGPLDHHGGLFNCRDALSSSGDVNGNGSAGAPVCIPLLFVGIPLVCDPARAADDAGIAREAVLPERVTEHDHGRLARLLKAQEYPAA